MRVSSEIEDLNDLSAGLAEVKGLSLLRNNNQLKSAFSHLRECIELRISKIGPDNIVNVVMCCQIVATFFENREVMRGMEDKGMLEVIWKAEEQYLSLDCYWMIKKARFLIESQKEN